MRRFIIIIVVIFLATPGAFALTLASGRSPSDTTARRVVPPASVRSKTTTTTRVTTAPPTAAASARDRSILARVTVYWASGGRGSDRYTRQHKTSTGLRLRTGHCAVDPKHIPYGSRVVFPDGSTLAAVDTGTAVKNRKAARLSGRTAGERNAVVVDRFFETKRQALAWAKTHPLFMPVRVVTPNYRPLQPQRTVVASNSPRVALPPSATAPIMKALPVTPPTAKKYQLVASNQAGAKNKVRR